jgi:HEAT repeat protein
MGGITDKPRGSETKNDLKSIYINEIKAKERNLMKSKIEELIQGLSSNNSIERIKSRHELVKIGKPAIEFLIGLQYSDFQHIRWEAIKTLSQIADPNCIPILINALENEMYDVRWLAAEGLIEIGKESLIPLFETLVIRQDSKFVREGVHHILKTLESKKLFIDNYEIVRMLEDYNANPSLAITARQILSQNK